MLSKKKLTLETETNRQTEQNSYGASFRQKQTKM